MPTLGEYAAASDASLVLLAREKDQRAFAVLVARHQNWLRNLLRRLCHDRALADDLAQQVLFNAWETLPEPTVTGNPALGLDLDRALAQLGPAVRLCVVLAHDAGMSHGAIAEVTGLPLGTVKSHITRGSAQLRAYLAAYQRGGSNDA